MPLSITILTEGSLTASVVGQGIVASIVPSQALLEVNVGVPGASATVSVGTTTTGDAGTDASVVNVGTTTAAILDFTIPRGDKGEQGNKGDAGDSATINVGETSTLSAGSPATVTNSGTTQNAVFNFGIPQGYQGVKGDKGDQGDPGVGVPAGGTFGQGLIKTSNTFDYETAWAGPFVSLVDTNLQGMAGTLQVQGLDLDGNSISNVDFIQVNTVNVTYGVSPKIHFSDGDQITAWIDAPSDGSTYGRKDGAWSIVGSSGSYLPLTGGSMSGDIIWPAVGTGSDSQIGTFGFGTENVTLGQTAYVEPDQIRIYDGSHPIGTSLNGEGITFNDETTQSTAGLPLTGGTVTGDTHFGNIENVINVDVTGQLTVNYATTTYIGDGISVSDISGGVEIYSQNIQSTNPDGNTFTISNAGIGGLYNADYPWSLTSNGVSGGYGPDGSFALDSSGVYFGQNNAISFTGSGITFSDSTVQTTAGIPEAPIDGNAYVRKDGAWVNINDL